MKEIVIQHFFEGHATAQEMAADAVGAFDRRTDSAGAVFSSLRCVSMAHEFAVTGQYIVKLIDAVEPSGLDLEALDAICFAVEASDNFTWDTDMTDGERVAKALFWLGSPEVNYPITKSVLAKVKHYVLTGEETFTREDLRPAGTKPATVVNQVSYGPKA